MGVARENLIVDGRKQGNPALLNNIPSQSSLTIIWGSQVIESDPGNRSHIGCLSEVSLGLQLSQMAHW